MPVPVGVLNGGSLLSTPASLPGATRIVTVTTAGLLQFTVSTSDFEAAGAIATHAALTSGVHGISAFGATLIDDANAGAARTTLELGTLATQNGTFSGTSSGTNTGDQSLFSTIAVSGQSNVVADQAGDTLTLVGSGVTITTDASTDTITFTVSAGSPGGASGDMQFNNAGAFGGATGVTYQSGSSPNTTFTAQNAAHTALRAKTAATPTVPPLDCCDSANTQTFFVNPAGTGIGYRHGASVFNHLWSAHQGSFSDRPGIVISMNSAVSTPSTYSFGHFPLATIGGVNTSTIFLGSGSISGTVHALVSASPRQGMLQGNGGSGTNVAGGKLIIAPGAGTGSAASGDISFQVAPAGSSGTTLNALAEAMKIDSAKLITLADAANIAVNTTTGTKIGTATGQKIAFWNATPVVQQVLATGAGATVDDVITLLQTLGLCKQS